MTEYSAINLKHDTLVTSAARPSRINVTRGAILGVDDVNGAAIDASACVCVCVCVCVREREREREFVCV
jgi:hypothetical protein